MDADHYGTLGLDRYCTAAQVRAAYRVLAKQFHPDVNAESTGAAGRIQKLNAAYEILSDPVHRRAYDQALRGAESAAARGRSGKIQRNISHDVNLRIEDFLRGTSFDVVIRDPANPHGAEAYTLVVPAMTALGTRFRLPREAPFAGGHVVIRVRALPGGRYRARGSDLRIVLRITARRAAEGGTETLTGATGSLVRVEIPANVRRGEILKVRGEGLPKARGGRGDLLVRITYRPEVRVTRR